MERIHQYRFGYCVSCKKYFSHVISINIVSHAVFAYIVKLALPKEYIKFYLNNLNKTRKIVIFFISRQIHGLEYAMEQN